MNTWLPASRLLVEQLLQASVQGAVCIALLWLVVRLAPRLPAWLRGSLWWLACFKMFLALVWMHPVAVPWRPEALPGPVQSVATAIGTRAADTLPAVVGKTDAVHLPWSLLLAAAWCTGILIQAFWTLRQLRSSYLVLRDSRPADARVAARFAALRRVLGVRQSVRLLVAPNAETAQVLGILRPVVVLPEQDLRVRTDDELEMALAHELLHIRRGDLWLGWLPVLVQRLFFFHPLVGLAVREYALAREAACDAEVLSEIDASPRAYGRLLLDLGLARREIGALAVGMAASPKVLERRLRMLKHASESGPGRPSVWLLLLAAALIGTLPVRVVGVGPKAKSSGDDSKSHTINHSWSSTDDSREAFALIKGGDTNMMNGTMDDANLAQDLWRKDHRDLLLFRVEERMWVVRDPAYVKEAERIVAPQMELGGKQGALGARQGELGAQQAELGHEQAKLGRRQAKLAAEVASLAARQAYGMDEEEQAKLQSRIRELGRQQHELGQEQGELGAKQGALGVKQSELGAQQSEIGRQQAEAAEAAKPELRDLLQRAIEAGLAEEIEP
jgi:beta-lactamase regulating signal transducer with metallopeptidase domain